MTKDPHSKKKREFFRLTYEVMQWQFGNFGNCETLQSL